MPNNSDLIADRGFVVKGLVVDSKPNKKNNNKHNAFILCSSKLILLVISPVNDFKVNDNICWKVDLFQFVNAQGQPMLMANRI